MSMGQDVEQGTAFQARALRKEERDLAQKFYRSSGHYTVIQPMDDVFGVYMGDKLSGVARVTPEFNALILKGVVFKDASNEVEGMRSMIPVIISALDKKKFYSLVDEKHSHVWEEMGFKSVTNENELSEHLLKRRDFGLNRNSKLCWMVWSS